MPPRSRDHTTPPKKIRGRKATAQLRNMPASDRGNSARVVVVELWEAGNPDVFLGSATWQGHPGGIHPDVTVESEALDGKRVFARILTPDWDADYDVEVT